MQSKLLQIGLTIFLLVIYAILFSIIYSSDSRLDFLSFYSSFDALNKEQNPYQLISTPINTPFPGLIPANLNPPILFFFLSPLMLFDYYTSLTIWNLFSIILGILGARKVFYYSFSLSFIKKNGYYLYLIYLLCLPTLMNLGIAQIGSFLLYFLIYGYDFYIKKQDIKAGIFWGIIAAIKLFPALLLLFLIFQKRYFAFLIMFLTLLGLTLVPVIIYGSHIYHDYISMMHQVVWYGKSWNGSLLGMLYRLFINNLELPTILFLYLFLAVLILIYYVAKIVQLKKIHATYHAFCLTAVIMLYLSPFAWLYYFSILLIPLTFIWVSLQNKMTKIIMIAVIILINLPINNIPLIDMDSLISRLSYGSFLFYGLTLILYLINSKNMFINRLS